MSKVDYAKDLSDRYEKFFAELLKEYSSGLKYGVENPDKLDDRIAYLEAFVLRKLTRITVVLEAEIEDSSETIRIIQELNQKVARLT